MIEKQSNKQLKLNNMGTTNFAYQNRCVFVSNEDYEFGNIPTLGNCVNKSRNYPSYILEEYDFFKYYQIVITSGYYEGACIDFIETNYTIEDVLGSYTYYNTKKDFIKECCNEFGLSKHKVNKLCGNIKDYENNLDMWLQNAYEKIDEYIKTIEEKECNKIIDQIKEEYGYIELSCVGIFSNGEGVYKQLA